MCFYDFGIPFLVHYNSQIRPVGDPVPDNILWTTNGPVFVGVVDSCVYIILRSRHWGTDEVIFWIDWSIILGPAEQDEAQKRAQNSRPIGEVKMHCRRMREIWIPSPALCDVQTDERNSLPAEVEAEERAATFGQRRSAIQISGAESTRLTAGTRQVSPLETIIEEIQQARLLEAGRFYIVPLFVRQRLRAIIALH